MLNGREKHAVKEFVPSPEFPVRKKRIDDAINLRKPDRVPVIPLNYTFYPIRVKGISNREAMYYFDKAFQVWKSPYLNPLRQLQLNFADQYGF